MLTQFWRFVNKAVGNRLQVNNGGFLLALLLFWTFQEALDLTHKRWEDWCDPSRLLSYWVKEVCQSWVFCTARPYGFPHDHHGLFRRRRSTRLSALGSKIPAYVLITGVYWLIYSTRGNVDSRDTISTELTRRNIIHLMHSLNDVNEHKKYPVFFCVLRISI